MTDQVADAGDGRTPQDGERQDRNTSTHAADHTVAGRRAVTSISIRTRGSISLASIIVAAGLTSPKRAAEPGSRPGSLRLGAGC